MPGSALVVSELGRRYGDFEALRDFNLEVAAGECVALIGHNGSGKTTALRTIAGLMRPSTGSVMVDGHSMHDEPEALHARAAVATVLDTPTLYDDLSVRQHLELVAIAHGAAGADLADRITASLALFGLERRGDMLPTQLSRGLRQRVQLACAFIRPHRLLLLDEPVVGLDPGSQRTLKERLLHAKRDGTAVLLTTHQLEFARGLADRAVVLAEGDCVAAGDYDTVVADPLMREYGLT